MKNPKKKINVSFSKKKRLINKTERSKKKKFIHIVGGADAAAQAAFLYDLGLRQNFLEPEIEGDILSKYNNLKRTIMTERHPMAKTGRVFEEMKDEPPLNRTFTELQTSKGELDDISMSSSVISYIDLQGIVLRKEFKIVPFHTYICFLSPLDYSFGHNFNDSEFFLNELLKMDEKKYKNLFKFRMGLRLGKLRSTIEKSTTDPNIFVSCFLNSQWYYPGQIYPDMKFSLDYEKLSQVRDIENIFYLTLNNFELKVDPPIHNPDVLSAEKLRFGSNDIRLSNIIKCQSRTEKYRLIIVSSSRGLENRSDYTTPQLEGIMNIELINYYLNKNVESNLLREPGDIKELVDAPFKSTCEFLDHEIERLLYYDEQNISSMIHKNYNSNYNSVVSTLEEIYNNIEKNVQATNVGASSFIYVSFLTYQESSFIASLHPKLFLQFMSKVKLLIIEKRRYMDFFQHFGTTIANILNKIMDYILKSLDFITLLNQSTIQAELFNVCLDVAGFLNTYDRHTKYNFCPFIKKYLKRIKKTPALVKILEKHSKEKKPLHLILNNPKEIKLLDFSQYEGVPPSIHIKIEDVTLVQFTKLNTIRDLTISNNHDIRINLNIEQKIIGLQKLCLENFQISSDVQLTDLYLQLHSLKLINCEISTKVNLSKLILLESLYLDEVSLTLLQGDINFITKITTLKQITLENMRIEIPFNINNPNLKSVILSNVEPIPHISPALELDLLKLYNLVRDVPEIPTKTKNLELANINLSNDLFVKIGDYTHLESLSILNCQIPDGIFEILSRFTKLKSLVLKCNLIKEKDVNFKELSHLTQLKLIQNSFETQTTIDKDIFKPSYDFFIVKGNSNIILGENLKKIKGKKQRVVSIR